MTPFGPRSDDDESIDPRLFARRAMFEPDDDESVVSAPRPAKPTVPIEESVKEARRARFDGSREAAYSWSAPPHSEPDTVREDTLDFAEMRGRKREILAEQKADWDEGRPASPEELLKRWPTSPVDDPDAASLLVEDYFQRRKRGENPSLDEYGERFPDQSRSLVSMVSRHVAFQQSEDTISRETVTLRLPDVGDEVFGFRLKYALGKGAFARVFLAGQRLLAGRPVVLKVSAIEGTEPQTLAQLQHTNIVPIYSVHDDPSAGLRAVCMPYFGGASLSGVLKALFAKHEVPRQGREFVEALQEVQAPPPESAGSKVREETSAAGQTPLATIAPLDYPATTIWIAARLAEGLQHAHQRGVLHRDIKPSNILVGSDGQPLLLDFNLAHDQNLNATHATIGGTIAYMAPEHLLALLRQSPEQAKLVDHRSDIYSMGMVIAEMLTGHHPFEQSASYSAFPLQIEAMAVDRTKNVPSLKALRPDIPWGLESVIRKCLDPDQGQRYQQAEHLAEDLRRLLDDQPLKYAPELSLKERGRKWTRRHPRMTTAGVVASIASVAILTMAAAYVGVQRHLNRTRSHLGAFQTRDRLAAHDAGTNEALTLVNTVIEREDLVRKGLAVCEKTLAIYDPPAGANAGEHPDWAILSPEQRLRVSEDRRELLMLSAGAIVTLKPGDPDALKQALARLDKAEAISGLPASRALWNDRAGYLARLGQSKDARRAQEKADAIPATSARDHYLLATSHARRGSTDDYARAIEELNQALRINPKHYWSLILRGVCFLETGDFIASAGDFGVCAGLRPDLVWGYFNRGYVLDRGGRRAEAIEDYTTAIARDPQFLPARINRGMALLQSRKYAEALADFEFARKLSGERDDATLSAGRGMALEGLGRGNEADKEFARALGSSTKLTTEARNRLLWTYGFAISTRLPAKAREAFQEVLRQDPAQPQALYGMAMLAMTEGQTEKSVSYFNRAIKAAPNFVEARRYRAIALARAFTWDQAAKDIHWCLEREPESGETLYAAACVSALAAAQIETPETRRQALDLLKKALDHGFGRDKLAKDPDLEALRHDPAFERLLHQGSERK